MLKSNQFYKKGTSKKYWYMANDKKYVNQGMANNTKYRGE